MSSESDYVPDFHDDNYLDHGGDLIANDGGDDCGSPAAMFGDSDSDDVYM